MKQPDEAKVLEQKDKVGYLTGWFLPQTGNNYRKAKQLAIEWLKANAP